jgi:hypothetical protein
MSLYAILVSSAKSFCAAMQIAVKKIRALERTLMCLSFHIL